MAFMKNIAVWPALTLTAVLSAPAWADRTTDQVAMAASGRFDQLEKVLEEQAARGPLDTRDRHALCYAYSKTKRYTQLMACLDQLAILLQKSGDKSTRLFALDDATPALGQMRAEALLDLGQYDAAIKIARANVSWLEEDQSDDLDMVYNSMAAVAIGHALNGDKAKGHEIVERMVKAQGGMFSAYSSAKALAIARARMALGDWQGVLDALDSDKLFSVNIFLDKLFSGGFLTGVNNWVWVELPRAFMLNKALLETGKLEQAKAGFDRVLALPQVKENGEIYWMLLSERARIAEQAGDKAAALAWLKQAIDVVEDQRASINTETSKIGFVGDKQAIYARAIALALALQQADSAYELMERGKSRALVDLLAARSGGANLAGRSADSARLLKAYQQAAEQAAAQLPLDMARAGGAESRSAARQQVLQLKAADPALASLVSVGALSLADVRRYLRPNEVLVEYHQHGSQLAVVAVSADQVQSAVIDGANLERDVRAFRGQIEQQQAGALAAGQALYGKLLGPVAALIAGRHLVIVPHGALHYLPFAALHDGKAYLPAAHQLRFLPSASVQQYLRAPRAAQMDSMLVFGNPDLGNPQLDLPAAEEEARKIAGMLPGSRLLTRGVASESAFKEVAPQFRFLHVAAHGQFRADVPLQSRLALASDKHNDGSLTVSEIYGLQLDADLVTLSACETGLNRAMSGDDLIGMTRGFLYAGSSNIIASLWEVDDEATAELMVMFYEKLRAGLGKAQALQEAQQALWKKFPEPRYWAAFYLTGQGA
jgi:CHAT domain-containing protein